MGERCQGGLRSGPCPKRLKRPPTLYDWAVRIVTELHSHIRFQAGKEGNYPEDRVNPLTPFTFYLDWVFCAQFAGLCWAQEKGLYTDVGLQVELVPWGQESATAIGSVSGATAVPLPNSMGTSSVAPSQAAGSIPDDVNGCAWGETSGDLKGELVEQLDPSVSVPSLCSGTNDSSVIDKVLARAARGRLSAGSCEDNLVVSRVAKDGSVKAFGAMLQETPLVLMSLPTQYIRTLEDLRGKRIGMHADGIRVLEIQLQLAGIPRDEVSIEEVGFDLEHLREHRFDSQQGYAMTEPVQLESLGVHVDLVRLSSDHLHPYTQSYFAPSPMLETNREAFAAFLRASSAGWLAACCAPDEAAQIVARAMGDRSQAQAQTQRTMLDRVAPLITGQLQADRIGTINTQQWKRNLVSYFQTGLVDRLLELDEVAADLSR